MKKSTKKKIKRIIKAVVVLIIDIIVALFDLLFIEKEDRKINPCVFIRAVFLVAAWVLLLNIGSITYKSMFKLNSPVLWIYITGVIYTGIHAVANDIYCHYMDVIDDEEEEYEEVKEEEKILPKKNIVPCIRDIDYVNVTKLK